MVNTKKLQALMTLHDYTYQRLADEMGLSYTTIYNKINKNPSDLKQSEIMKLCELLKIDNVNEIFFNDEITPNVTL